MPNDRHQAPTAQDQAAQDEAGLVRKLVEAGEREAAGTALQALASAPQEGPPERGTAA